MPPPSTTSASVPYTRDAIWSCLPATTRGKPVQLDAHPKGTSFLYTNGRTVIIRDLTNPEISTEYNGHSFPVTVARYSPSGYYIASGDIRGNIRIWDCTQPEQILKAEYQVLSGSIQDLCWDNESKRIIIVGDGREKFGHAILFDTGSSVGEIVGHSKICNAVSIRPLRPYRAVTCSDDMTVNFYNGVPYKFVTSITDHSRFVTAVRFSPSGNYFISVAMDSKIYLYDGNNGNKIKEIIDNNGHGHTGGIFAVAWSPDSKQFITSSADCTVKLWDVDTSQVIRTWTFDSSSSSSSTNQQQHNPMNQQIGNLWCNEYLLTVSLSGDIHYLNPNSDTITRTLYGHQKNITALAYDITTKTIITGSYDGVICSWNVKNASQGANKVNKNHNNKNMTMSQIQGLVINDNKDKTMITSIHLDDTLRITPLSTTNNNEIISVKLLAQPTNMVIANKGIHYIVTVNGVIWIDMSSNDKKEQPILDIPTGVSSITISPDKSKLAIGTINKEVIIISLNQETGRINKIIGNANNSKGIVTCMAFNPKQDNIIAVGDSNGKIIVYEITSSLQIKYNQWVYHTARITSIAWHSNGKYAVSSSIDTNIGIWNTHQPNRHIMIRNAHVDASTAALWIDETHVISVGNDASVKQWKINTWYE